MLPYTVEEWEFITYGVKKKPNDSYNNKRC